jgi:hypothetical protein
MRLHCRALQMRPLVEMESSGLLALLRTDALGDLGRLYALLRRVEGGLALVRGMMADTIREQGRHLVNVRCAALRCVAWLASCAVLCCAVCLHVLSVSESESGGELEMGVQ